MVDFCATEHVITDKSKFINFDPGNHFVELADGDLVNNIMLKRGNAFIYTIAKDTCVDGGARGVMVIVVGNGHGDTSSNPGRDWLHFT